MTATVAGLAVATLVALVWGWWRIRRKTPFASSDSFDETTENLSHVKSSRLLLETSAPLLMTPILALRPTQMAVGMQQVGVKEAKVSAKVLHQPNKKKADKWLRSRPVPVVLGPGGPSSQQPQRYLIDHHHLTFALFRQGITHCYCQVVSDQSALGWEQFWEYMEGQHYVWPYSSDGTPLSLQEFVAHLPSDVRGLKDDPYRSLAALVRGEGGYEKVWVPFSEFRWANWLRSAVPLKEGEDPAQTHVVQAAVRLAGTPQAQHLPGFKAAS